MSFDPGAPAAQPQVLLTALVDTALVDNDTAPVVQLNAENANGQPSAAPQPIGNAPRVTAAPPVPGKGKKKAGLNENYARELMELHTLGVDGGYTQQDVQEVARCFTGWGFSQQTGEFQFNPRRHDGGRKVVLGHTIPAGGGIRDGEQVLDILASHPATAHFIAHKLCMRLVADEPPAALVERTAQTFQASGGDLKAVVKTIVTAPEFFSAGAYRSKIKSPFEYAVSAVRALDGHFEAPNPSDPTGWRLLMADGSGSARGKGGGIARRQRTTLAKEIATMGEPLFAYQAPTGYPEDSQHWVSAGALIARLNFALALTNNQVSGVTISADALLAGALPADHKAAMDQLGVKLLGGDVSGGTRAVIAAQMPDGAPVNPARMAALLLGAPEFQRR